MELEQRMYGLVPYNISPIQQAIQYGHAVVEYFINYPMDMDVMDKLGKWAHYDKTFIILNGGTTNTHQAAYGTLNQHMKTLIDMRIDYSTFYEPDLGDQLTAIVFLVDERVWDKEKYPSPNIVVGMSEKQIEVATNTAIIGMGGIKNWEFRQFLNQFKLA